MNHFFVACRIMLSRLGPDTIGVVSPACVE